MYRTLQTTDEVLSVNVGQSVTLDLRKTITF